MVIVWSSCGHRKRCQGPCFFMYQSRSCSGRPVAPQWPPSDRQEKLWFCADYMIERKNVPLLVPSLFSEARAWPMSDMGHGGQRPTLAVGVMAVALHIPTSGHGAQVPWSHIESFWRQTLGSKSAAVHRSLRRERREFKKVEAVDDCWRSQGSPS